LSYYDTDQTGYSLEHCQVVNVDLQLRLLCSVCRVIVLTYRPTCMFSEGEVVDMHRCIGSRAASFKRPLLWVDVCLSATLMLNI